LPLLDLSPNQRRTVRGVGELPARRIPLHRGFAGADPIFEGRLPFLLRDLRDSSRFRARQPSR
jgi:hypothetical protein